MHFLTLPPFVQNPEAFHVWRIFFFLYSFALSFTYVSMFSCGMKKKICLLLHILNTIGLFFSVLLTIQTGIPKVHWFLNFHLGHEFVVHLNFFFSLKNLVFLFNTSCALLSYPGIRSEFKNTNFSRRSQFPESPRTPLVPAGDSPQSRDR